MTLDEYIEQLEEVNNELKANIPRLVFEYGQSVLDQIQERIQEKGLKPDGSKLKDYSPFYLAFKKNPGDYPEGKKLGLSTSRYTGVVDYTLTGEMWRNIGLIREDEGSLTFSWGGRSEASKKKLIDLSARDGDVFGYSQEEIEEADIELEEEIEKILRPIL